MKLFKKVEVGDCIYAVYDNGVVSTKWVTSKREDWYEHKCQFHFDIGSICVNMDMSVCVDEDVPDLLYFADKEKAIEHINYIRNKAIEIIDICEESLDILLK